MFPRRYFPGRHFPPRYWPPAPDRAAPAAPAAVVRLHLACFPEPALVMAPAPALDITLSPGNLRPLLLLGVALVNVRLEAPPPAALRLDLPPPLFVVMTDAP